jgi:hypothetical protein
MAKARSVADNGKDYNNETDIVFKVSLYLIPHLIILSFKNLPWVSLLATGLLLKAQKM